MLSSPPLKYILDYVISFSGRRYLPKIAAKSLTPHAFLQCDLHTLQEMASDPPPLWFRLVIYWLALYPGSTAEVMVHGLQFYLGLGNARSPNACSLNSIFRLGEAQATGRGYIHVLCVTVRTDPSLWVIPVQVATSQWRSPQPFESPQPFNSSQNEASDIVKQT